MKFVKENIHHNINDSWDRYSRIILDFVFKKTALDDFNIAKFADNKGELI